MTDSNQPVPAPAQGLVLSNNTYNNAKFVVQIVLPALAVLYASLSEFWGFPRVQEVVGTVSALALFLGIVLRISSASYSQTASDQPAVGNFVVTEDVDGKKTVSLDLEQDPASFIDGENIVFKIKKSE